MFYTYYSYKNVVEPDVELVVGHVVEHAVEYVVEHELWLNSISAIDLN